MNPWHSFAEALAAELRAKVPACSPALPEAGRVDIVVWRQDDLYSVADSLTAKAAGMGVILAGTGGRNPDPSSKELRMGGNFSISVWASPVHCGEIHADDLCWALASAAHGFVVAAGPNDVTRRLEIADVGIAPDKRFLIWEAKGTVKRLAADGAIPPAWDADADLWNA